VSYRREGVITAGLLGLGFDVNQGVAQSRLEGELGLGAVLVVQNRHTPSPTRKTLLHTALQLQRIPIQLKSINQSINQ